MRTPDNRVGSVIERYRLDLAPLYPDAEVKAIVRTVFHERLGWDASDLELRKQGALSESELLRVYLPLRRLATGEPLQYVLGGTHFLGLRLKVGPSVLIPRPETEELVDHILADRSQRLRRIVDIGTGSGCIALALKRNRPQAHVVGMDRSEQALRTARENAALNALEVEFVMADALAPGFALPHADLVVSNPPYVPRSEAPSLAAHVMEHEPHLALFVPDEDPLVFYRAIATAAAPALPRGGALWFEAHRAHAHGIAALLRGEGWDAVRVLKDLSGHDRFVHAVKR